MGAALRAAVAGSFPPVDGRYDVVAPWRVGLEGVIAFTGHALLAIDDDHDVDLDALGVDGFGGAHHPNVMMALSGPDGWVDSLDLVVMTTGLGGPPALVERADLATHPRAVYNAGLRDDLAVYGRPTEGSIVTVGRGLGGLHEVGVETEGAAGAGISLLRDVRTMVPVGEPVVAAVAPGNARAVRSFLAAGFVPVASVQLFRRR